MADMQNTYRFLRICFCFINLSPPEEIKAVSINKNGYKNNFRCDQYYESDAPEFFCIFIKSKSIQKIIDIHPGPT